MCQSFLSKRQWWGWRVAQTVVWFIGLAIIIALFFAPEAGIHAFWNVLIPVAPALLVFAPGLWRNICPLASTALAARHFGLSRSRKISLLWQGRLSLIGVLLLFAIVPFRHALLDTSGPYTALTILFLTFLAIFMGLTFEWKSGWCSGLCPVHPVEKLYGQEPCITLANAHCETCQGCVEVCPDSLPANQHPMRVKRTYWHRWAKILMLGGFPGFIWGWFQVPDYSDRLIQAHFFGVYGYPLGGAVVTLALFLTLKHKIPSRQHLSLLRIFAASAVACYYWYRLPMLFGFGPFPGDGMLIDLRSALPETFPAISRLFTTSLFFWWLVLKPRKQRPWTIRPPMAAIPVQKHFNFLNGKANL